MRVPYSAPMGNGGYRHYGGEPTRGVLIEGRYRYSYRGKNYGISRLICEAFAGPPPFAGAVCMHLDEDATNNRSDNLAWGTQKENLAAPGFRAYCKRRTTGPKITPEQARVIKYGAQSARKVAVEFGISASTVSNIRTGKAWRHI